MALKLASPLDAEAKVATGLLDGATPVRFCETGRTWTVLIGKGASALTFEAPATRTPTRRLAEMRGFLYNAIARYRMENRQAIA